MVSPQALRAKAGSFMLGLRGYAPTDVEAYLERIATMVEVFGEDADHATAFPNHLGPGAIRGKEFPIVWRGFDRDEVRAYLQELGNDVEAMLNAPPIPSRPAVLHLPASFARSTVHPGILDGSEISTGGRRKTVRFATPEALVAELAIRLENAESCVVPRTIVVADLSATTLRRAIAELDESGEI